MILFGWCIEFNHGQIGFSKSKKELITLATQRGEGNTQPFPVYKEEIPKLAADAAQPGDSKDGSRTT